jgi:hypothetical protein
MVKDRCLAEGISEKTRLFVKQLSQFGDFYGTKNCRRKDA